MPKLSEITLVALFAVGLFACSKDEPVAVDMAYAYFPLMEQAYYEYDVDSIVFDDFQNSVDTYSFVVREEVREMFTDLEGDPAYRIERLRRDSDTAEWRVTHTYASKIDGVRAERVEDNRRYIKLVFPPREDSEWDGNAFNSLAPQEYRIDYVDERKSLNDITFDSVVRVIQREDTNSFIFKYFAEERYARNVGLIYKEVLIKETQFDVDSGLHYIQRIRDWSPI